MFEDYAGFTGTRCLHPAVAPGLECAGSAARDAANPQFVKQSQTEHKLLGE